MTGLEPHISLQGSIHAIGMFSCFVVLLFIGSRFIPAQEIAGGASASGIQQIYTLNGLTLFILVFFFVGIGQFLTWWSLTAIIKNFVELFIVANLFAFSVAFILFAFGRRKTKSDSILHAIRDFYYGTEANPKWLKVDLKMFSYRPSLIGLALINSSFAAVQYNTYESLSTSMILYQGFTFLYILNYFQFEYGMIFTWDIIEEKFGWMLVWGNYVLVPFFYSLPGWFLIHNLDPMPIGHVVGLITLFSIGFLLFRGANEQKHRFKINPQTHIWGRPAKALNGRILTSGFWGIGRHLNYTGEILIYIAFALTTGLGSWIPYLLPLWLIGLLLHRAWRDEQRCQEKYGDLWDQYKRNAKFRMVPLIY